MTNKQLPLFLLLSLSLFSSLLYSKGQSIDDLENRIKTVLKGKNATVGIAILGAAPLDSLSINGNTHLPMQSVFKYQLALAVLNLVDKGSLRLTDKITITKKDLDNNLYNPIRKNIHRAPI